MATPLAIVVPIPKGAWNATAVYNLLNVVTHDGRGYICKQAGSGIEPTPTGNSQWQLIADRGEAMQFDQLTQAQKDNLAQSANAAAAQAASSASEAATYAASVRSLLEQVAGSADPGAAITAQVAANTAAIGELGPKVDSIFGGDVNVDFGSATKYSGLLSKNNTYTNAGMSWATHAVVPLDGYTKLAITANEVASTTFIIVKSYAGQPTNNQLFADVSPLADGYGRVELAVGQSSGDIEINADAKFLVIQTHIYQADCTPTVVLSKPSNVVSGSVFEKEINDINDRIDEVEKKASSADSVKPVLDKMGIPNISVDTYQNYSYEGVGLFANNGKSCFGIIGLKAGDRIIVANVNSDIVSLFAYANDASISSRVSSSKVNIDYNISSDGIEFEIPSGYTNFGMTFSSVISKTTYCILQNGNYKDEFAEYNRKISALGNGMLTDFSFQIVAKKGAVGTNQLKLYSKDSDPEYNRICVAKAISSSNNITPFAIDKPLVIVQQDPQYNVMVHVVSADMSYIERVDYGYEEIIVIDDTSRLYFIELFPPRYNKTAPDITDPYEYMQKGVKIGLGISLPLDFAKNKGLLHESYRIVCWGDSRTAQGWFGTNNGLTGLENYIKDKRFSVVGAGVGGETTLEISCRQGGTTLVCAPFLIPSGKTSVDVKIYALHNGYSPTWILANETQSGWQTRSLVNPVTICGVKGEIHQKVSLAPFRENADFTFTRLEEGESVSVKGGSVVTTNGSVLYKDDIIILFSGANDKLKEEDIDNFIGLQKSIVAGHKKYIVISDYFNDNEKTDNDTQTLVKLQLKKQQEAFGNHVCDLYTYLINYAHIDLGISLSAEDEQRRLKGIVPSVYWGRNNTDRVHQNATAQEITQRLVYEKGVELGYWL